MKKTIILVACLLPLTTLCPSSVWANGADFSIHISGTHDDLFSRERGILKKKNRMNRGREWERPAQFILRGKDQNEIFSSPIGLRVHGGKSRRRVDPSVRAYFRKDYESSKVKLSTFFPGKKGNIKSIVIHRANSYVSYYAMPMAKQMGALTPEIVPAKLYINEEDYGSYFVNIQLKKKYWAKEINTPKEEIIYVRMKGIPEKTDSDFPDFQYYINYRDSLVKKELLTYKEMSKQFEMKNLMAHLLSLAYLGNTDWRQGALYKTTAPKDKWRFINWDLEHSIKDIHATREDRTIGDRPSWSQEGFELISLGAKQWYAEFVYYEFEKFDIRELVFYRLWLESSEFRSKFTKFVNDTLDSKITASFLNSVIENVDRIAASHSKEPAMLAKSKAFFPCRAGFIKNQLRIMNKLPFSKSITETRNLRELYRTTMKETHNYSCDLEGKSFD